MKRTRKARLVIEKDSLIIVSRSRAGNRWCGICGDIAEMIDLAKAAAIFETSQRDLIRYIENGGLHFVETEIRGLLLCFNSLVNLFACDDAALNTNSKRR